MQYRNLISNKKYKSVVISEEESNILILAKDDIKSIAKKYLNEARNIIKEYINNNPGFESAFEPIEIDNKAPDIIKKMIKSCAIAGVGPMASVAGAVADYLGKNLDRHTDELIIENGGDIFANVKESFTVALYAGVFSNGKKLGVKLPASNHTYGICTSSGKIGHSYSMGKADALTVISQEAVIADAFATSLANRLKNCRDIKKVLNIAKKQPEILACAAIIEAEIGVIGNIELKNI